MSSITIEKKEYTKHNCQKTSLLAVFPLLCTKAFINELSWNNYKVDVCGPNL